MLTLLPVALPLLLFASGPDDIPKKLRASIGGFPGPSFSVELQGRVLIYTESRGSKGTRRVEVTPSAQQWREFRHELDALNVWRWRENYPNASAMDGTQWSLEVEYAEQAIRAHGSNNYPNDTGEPSNASDPTRAFRAYLATVQKLLGGRPFA